MNRRKLLAMLLSAIPAISMIKNLASPKIVTGATNAVPIVIERDYGTIHRSVHERVLYL